MTGRMKVATMPNKPAGTVSEQARDDSAVVCVIPAKINSTRCPNKNFRRVFGGKNAVELSIGHWNEATRFLPVPVRLRPVVFVNATDYDVSEPHERLFDDTSDLPILQVMQKVCERLELSDNDIVLWLQPTSPFRCPHKISEAVLAVESGLWDSAASCLFRKPEYFTGDGTPRFDVRNLVRWQDYDVSRILHIMDGNLFCFRVGPFRKSGTIYGERTMTYASSSLESLEVDTEEDMETVRLLWLAKNNPISPR